MEKLELKHISMLKALNTLEEVLDLEPDSIIRDSAIKRFEYSFEAFWKYWKEYLNAHEGIVANSPKTCFREMFAQNIIDSEQTNKLLAMTDRRNETSHTYNEKLSEQIFREIPEYFKLMKTVIEGNS